MSIEAPTEAVPLMRTIAQADAALSGPVAEAKRQVEICNACRYCEGYCAVFPAIARQRSFTEGDIVQLANLCHNCRGCYYACQYTAPHQFDLNVPGVLAEVRATSFETLVWPGAVARLFQRSGVAMALLTTLALAALWVAIRALPGGEGRGGAGFYAYLSHAAMVAIFAPAFLAPLAVVALAVRRYGARVGAAPVGVRAVWRAAVSAGRADNLSGGAAGGCNYEDDDAYSQARRTAHQLAMWGFLMCFASTSSATLMHYLLAWPAPYPLLSPPKLLGVPGGILLCIGTAWLLWLKTKADPALGAPGRWGGEAGLSVLLFLTGSTGLALYAATGTGAVEALLAVHLGAVLALFLLLPYSKMVHGFIRLAALAVDHARREGAR